MRIIDNCELKPYNTFGIAAKASKFVIVDCENEIEQFFQKAMYQELFFLGEGSNVLFTEDFQGTILHYSGKGIVKEKSTAHHTFIRAAAGEHWDDLVKWTVNNGLGGLENLSWIPGCVGSCPIQNIGAFGAEVGEFIETVRVFDTKERIFKELNRDECQFGYRSSVFKTSEKSRYFITSVLFSLPINHKPIITYGKIKEAIDQKGIKEPSIQQIRDVIIEIRKSRLPDPLITGNAGSFFKNPTIEKEQFNDLKQKFPQIVYFDSEDGRIKLAAAWLIEQCGWKGYRQADVGVHEHQALVIVNYGNANGKDIVQLAMAIQKSVFDAFGVNLEPEVNFVP